MESIFSFLGFNFSNPVWQLIVFWLWAVTALGGAAVVIGGLASSIFQYYISSTAERAADVRIAEAGKIASEANERAVLAQLNLERERVERLRLEAAVQKISPRTILPAQADAIRAALAQSTARAVPITVTNDTNCPDCGPYATEIRDLLRSLGFMIDEQVVVAANIRSKRGLVFAAPREPSSAAAASEVAKAFADAGLVPDIASNAPMRMVRPGPGILGPGMAVPGFEILILSITPAPTPSP